ncbi:uncharacterized protein LOC123373646 isoform X1 [Mauremys mutica]|uniref:uncharacterized protein LOC123373646 isoform X1 n=1 Tax=Mauremys mutica TaxID=74926 RepID=UPI001D16A8FF|nr:uncharacterized protein LOC123373646 isoform X1 [Mauremys mutica]
MELDKSINSAVTKKPNEDAAVSCRKRLSFLDDINVSEDDQKLRETVKVIAGKEVTAKAICFLTFGLCLVKTFTQQRLDIVGVTYNSKTRRLILVDGKGLFSLDLLASKTVGERDLYLSGSRVKREMGFHKYQFNIVRSIIYCEKFNVYFILRRDYALKVYNKDYEEICSVENVESRLLTLMVFNPVSDELITGGIKGIKFWKFKETESTDYSDAVHMSNYKLFPSAEFPHMRQIWCTNMEFDVNMQRLYCFSNCDLFCYDTKGNILFQLTNAHQSTILSCVYSSYSNALLTSSRDSEIKSWNDQGCLLHVFHGHTRSVTHILLHPNTLSLFISGSLDGTVKLWSLDTMELFYSLSLFTEGIVWMGLTEDKLLYCSSARNLHVYDLNYFTKFWTHVSSQIKALSLCGANGKSSRVVAMGSDNSLRIFSLHNGTKLCTVLPPPYPPLQSVLSFAYNRTNGTIYFLLTSWDIWVYTARTDPACRAAVWTIEEIHRHLNRKHPLASCVQKNEYFQHTRKESVRDPVRCKCLCSLSSPICYWIDEGLVYADTQEFLVLGMQDGRILFLHTSIQNLVYYEMKAYKDPVIELKHDIDHHQLINMCQELEYKLVQIWSLPALKLLHQINISNETMVFTRINSSLFLGLHSGAVNVFDVHVEEGPVDLLEKNEKKPEGNEEPDITHDSENAHKGPVVAVDACKTLSLFLSCGADYMVKLWDIHKNLLADIFLDNTLSSACFLNGSGDILVAFKNDLYILPHSKALGISTTDTDVSGISATESFIYENQALNYQKEGKTDVSNVTDMDSYLVPYMGFNFTSNFTTELLDREKLSWKLPLAPSRIYCSPSISATSLKIFDFLFQPGPLSIDEREKTELSERMILTDDMKYLPGPRPAGAVALEIPEFGISPCSSPPSVCLEAQPEEEVAETESESPNTESLHQIPSTEQQQVSEEADKERTNLLTEGDFCLDKTQTLQMKRKTGSEKRKKKASKSDRFPCGKEKKLVPGKLSSSDGAGLRKTHTPKHKRFSSETQNVTMARDPKTVSRAHSAIPIGEKMIPTPPPEALAPAEKRTFLSKKTYQQKDGNNVTWSDKALVRLETWRRKENERTEHAKKKRAILELQKLQHLHFPTSHWFCTRPATSQQYQNLQISENLFEIEFAAWMQPHKKSHVLSHPCAVMQEGPINFSREFPYRLAWGPVTTHDLEAKLCYPRTMLDLFKEGKASSLLVERNLQPTRSIPSKGRYILVNAETPSISSTPPVSSPLEDRLLSVRFPKQKERMRQTLPHSVHKQSQPPAAMRHPLAL